MSTYFAVIPAETRLTLAGVIIDTIHTHTVVLAWIPDTVVINYRHKLLRQLIYKRSEESIYTSLAIHVELFV